MIRSLGDGKKEVEGIDFRGWVALLFPENYVNLGFLPTPLGGQRKDSLCISRLFFFSFSG